MIKKLILCVGLLSASFPNQMEGSKLWRAFTVTLKKEAGGEDLWKITTYSFMSCVLFYGTVIFCCGGVRFIYKNYKDYYEKKPIMTRVENALNKSVEKGATFWSYFLNTFVIIASLLCTFFFGLLFLDFVGKVMNKMRYY